MELDKAGVIDLATQRLKYTAQSNKNDAVALVELTIERAERLIADLKTKRDMLKDPAGLYASADVLGWAQNDAQNFVRNLDPDRWMRVASKLAVDTATANLLADLTGAEG